MENLDKDKLEKNAEEVKNSTSLEDLIKKNIEISQEILTLSKYIKKYIIWRKVMGWLKIFIILIPIFLAFVYLPPFLKDLSESFSSVLSNPSSIFMDNTNK